MAAPSPTSRSQKARSSRLFPCHCNRVRPQLPSRQPLHHQTANDEVDLLWGQLRAVVQPPRQNGHEGAGDVLGREGALLRRALDTEALEVQRHEIRDRAVNALPHESTARLAHYHRIQRQVTAGMLQHREAEAQTPLAYSAPRRERMLAS